MKRAFQLALAVKAPPAKQETRDTVQPPGREDPRRRAWQLPPVFLTGEPRGQKSLVGYSPQSCKASDMTEAIEHTHAESE